MTSPRSLAIGTLAVLLAIALLALAQGVIVGAPLP